MRATSGGFSVDQTSSLWTAKVSNRIGPTDTQNTMLHLRIIEMLELQHAPTIRVNHIRCSAQYSGLTSRNTNGLLTDAHTPTPKALRLEFYLVEVRDVEPEASQ